MAGIVTRAGRASAAAGATILFGFLLSNLDVERPRTGSRPLRRPDGSHDDARGAGTQAARKQAASGVGQGPHGARGKFDVVASDAPGRSAETPSEIPPAGWWQILKRTAQAVGKDGLMAQAAAVTFYGLLALFPALAMLVSLYGLIADPHTLTKNISAVNGVVPGGGMDIITGQLKSLTSSPQKALGVGFVIGLATSLWSATSGVKALMSALNVAYNETETRSFIRLTALAMAFTIGGIIFAIVAFAGVVVLPPALNILGVGGATNVLLRLLRWPVLLIGLGGFLSVIYRYGPCRANARWRWVTWGSVIATIGWLIVSIAFSYYTAHFGSYNKTYGTLGAAVGFMTWMWLSGTVILVGAELDAEMEHQTAQDTTVGADRPLGSRGATAADRVEA